MAPDDTHIVNHGCLNQSTKEAFIHQTALRFRTRKPPVSNIEKRRQEHTDIMAPSRKTNGDRKRSDRVVMKTAKLVFELRVL